MSGTCKDCAMWFRAGERNYGECALPGLPIDLPQECVKPFVIGEIRASLRYMTPAEYGCNMFVRKGPK